MRERGRECVRSTSSNSSTIPARCSVMTLEAIRYRAGSLQILNQLLLPHQTVYDDLRSVQDAYEAIKSMKVRQLHPPPHPPRHRARIPAERVFFFSPCRFFCAPALHTCYLTPAVALPMSAFYFALTHLLLPANPRLPHHPHPADSQLNVSFPIMVFRRVKLGTVSQPATHLTCPLLHFLRERLLMNY